MHRNYILGRNNRHHASQNQARVQRAQAKRTTRTDLDTNTGPIGPCHSRDLKRVDSKVDRPRSLLMWVFFAELTHVACVGEDSKALTRLWAIVNH